MQEKNYIFVVDLQKFVLSELREGAIAKDVYTKALEKIRTERPDLEPYFIKTFGFGVSFASPIFASVLTTVAFADGIGVQRRCLRSWSEMHSSAQDEHDLQFDDWIQQYSRCEESRQDVSTFTARFQLVS